MLRSLFREMKTILSISRDQLLLETRAAILRKSGHQVVSVKTLDDFAAAVHDPGVDLVILGHTLPAHEREDVFSILREFSCDAPVIELYATATPPRSTAQFHLAVHDRTFQTDLLALVRQVLSDDVN